MNDRRLAATTNQPVPPNWPTPPKFRNYNRLCQEADAAIKRLAKGTDGNYSFNLRSRRTRRDMSVLQFVNDRLSIVFAYEMEDLMQELQHLVLENGLADETDLEAVERLEKPISRFIVSQLHRSRIKMGGKEYHLSAHCEGPKPPSPPGDPHPIQFGSICITAALAGTSGDGEDGFHETGSIFCIYGHNHDHCEQSLLDQKDWSELSLELSETGKLTFVDFA